MQELKQLAMSAAAEPSIGVSVLGAKSGFGFYSARHHYAQPDRALHNLSRAERSVHLCGSFVQGWPPHALRQRGPGVVIPGAALTSKGLGRATARPNLGRYVSE